MSHVEHMRVHLHQTPQWWMSHVTLMNEACPTYGWVMSHIWISHVPHMNESYRTYEGTSPSRVRTGLFVTYRRRIGLFPLHTGLFCSSLFIYRRVLCRILSAYIVVQDIFVEQNLRFCASKGKSQFRLNKGLFPLHIDLICRSLFIDGVLVCRCLFSYASLLWQYRLHIRLFPLYTGLFCRPPFTCLVPVCRSLFTYIRLLWHISLSRRHWSLSAPEIGVGFCCLISYMSLFTNTSLLWHICVSRRARISLPQRVHPNQSRYTGWRRPTGCLTLQVIFCKRATNFKTLLRKLTGRAAARRTDAAARHQGSRRAPNIRHRMGLRHSVGLFCRCVWHHVCVTSNTQTYVLQTTHAHACVRARIHTHTHTHTHTHKVSIHMREKISFHICLFWHGCLSHRPCVSVP